MLKDKLSCPYCNKFGILSEEPRSFLKKIDGVMYTIHVTVLVYMCGCGSPFTTTEIDTITLNKVNSKANSIRRRIKIKKLF